MSLRFTLTTAILVLSIAPTLIIAVWFVPVPQRADGAELMWLAGVYLFVLVSVIAVGAYFVAGRLIKPLLHVVHQLDQVSARLDGRVIELGSPVRSEPVEVASIRRAVTRLLRRIAQDGNHRATVLAALTHDVKTSAVAARNALMMLRMGTIKPSSELDAMVLGELDALVERTQSLIDSIRYEQGRPFSSTPFDLSVAVMEAVQRARVSVGRSSIGVATSGHGTVIGDKEAVERAVENVVSNAIRHARSRVAVTVYPGVVRVEDDGPGLPGSFESLVRPYQSRVVAGRESGTAGLGLYVTRLISERHGGRLVLERSDGSGTVILVYFHGRTGVVDG